MCFCKVCYILFHNVVFLGSDPPNLDYEKQEFGFNAIRNERITEERHKICYNQTVFDDTRLEAAEYFGLTLEIQDLVAQGGPTTGYTEVDIQHAAIRITDDDGISLWGFLRPQSLLYLYWRTLPFLCL